VEKSVTEFGVAVQKTIAGTTKSAVDNAVAEYQALAVKIQEVRDTIAKKAKVTGVDQSDIQAQRAQLDQFAQQALAAQRATIIRLTQEEREAIRDSVTAAAAAATGSAAESARQAVEHQTAALYKQIEASHVLDESEKNRLRTEVALADELGRAKVAATTAAERVAGTVASIDASTARGALPDAGVLPALNAEALNAAQRMRELEAKGLTNSDAYREYQRQILTIEQRRKEILDAIATRLANQKQIAKDLAEQETQRIQAEAYAIQQAVDGALQLAAAFGLVGEETANVLRSVGQVAAGIGPLVDAVNRFKDGTGGIASLIGAALPVAGGIASLISATGIFSGPTPEQLQQEKTLRENTVALQHLTEKIGILGVDLTGTQASNAAASAEKLADLGFLGLDQKKVADFIAGYKDLGKLTQEQQDELKKAGEAFGLTMDGTIDSYQKAVRAILAANGKLGEFGDDFQSFTNQAEAARKIFGKDNPAQRLTDLATAATKASPAIAKLFEGLDLTKSGDLETLRKRIQDFFSVMEAGGQTLSAEDLGALTGDQLVQFLEQAIDGIDALSPAAQSAADKLATARQNLGTEFEIFGDDAKASWRRSPHCTARRAARWRSSSRASIPRAPPAWSSSSSGSRRSSSSCKTAPDSVDLAGLSVDQFIQALLDLKRGADAAAGGVEDAAARMQKAADSLKTDFEVYGTDAASQAAQLAQLYAGVGGIGGALAGIDFSTTAGRGAAITALQQLYGQDKGNDDAVNAILEILRALRAVPADQSGSGAKPTTQTSGAERITIEQADRLISLTESLLVFGRQTAQNTAALAALLRPPANAPVQAPLLPNAFLAGGAGAVRVEVKLMIVNHFHGPVGASGAAAGNELGTQIGQGASDLLDVALGNSLQRWDQVRGSAFARVGV
jgi:hypothetical protein